ncbi:glycosyltransferase [Bifidobacterium sp. SMB2]|uniref:Glycosyltransferase n=1 Tax=Bifidobacterium saimiriisciurei TaxID=2661627 RepID=A0ABX0CAQ4_9BIFI|nr:MULTISPECIES: glycosyltransferase family 2 protein [Bifidobacterium]NEG95344.1 glycosyltransferase [Bifidobacterium sp. SMB2]NEH11472.1 glycosyltransferase [Bifidobacterium saimiriisciurei]
MNEQQPLVSIIVPVYGVERYLDRCVESIVNQTYRNLEIILVDDGSPDACPRMCDGWAARDKRIAVVHKPNGGLASARNAGLDVMSGDLVTFVDSDDWVEPDYVSTLQQWMIEHKVEVSMCGTCIEYDDGRSVNEHPATPSGRWGADVALRRFLYHQGFTGAVWGRMFLADLFKGNEGIRFYEGLNSEDYYVHVQVFAQIEAIYAHEHHLYHYRRRADSITTGKVDSHACDEIQIADLCINYLHKVQYGDAQAMNYFRVQSRADVLFSLFLKRANRALLVDVGRGMRPLLAPIMRDGSISMGRKLRLMALAYAPYISYRLQRRMKRID